MIVNDARDATIIVPVKIIKDVLDDENEITEFDFLIYVTLLALSSNCESYTLIEDRFGFDKDKNMSISVVDQNVIGINTIRDYLYVYRKNSQVERANDIFESILKLIRHRYVYYSHRKHGFFNTSSKEVSYRHIMMGSKKDTANKIREKGNPLDNGKEDWRLGHKADYDEKDFILYLPIARKDERYTIFPKEKFTMLVDLCKDSVAKRELYVRKGQSVVVASDNEKPPKTLGQQLNNTSISFYVFLMVEIYAHLYTDKNSGSTVTECFIPIDEVSYFSRGRKGVWSKAAAVLLHIGIYYKSLKINNGKYGTYRYFSIDSQEALDRFIAKQSAKNGYTVLDKEVPESVLMARKEVTPKRVRAKWEENSDRIYKRMGTTVNERNMVYDMIKPKDLNFNDLESVVNEVMVNPFVLEDSRMSMEIRGKVEELLNEKLVERGVVRANNSELYSKIDRARIKLGLDE